MCCVRFLLLFVSLTHCFLETDSTHMVGKWHLGMSSWQFTPLQRGFDTYGFGYLGGAEDYWVHGHKTDLDFWKGVGTAGTQKMEPDFSHSCQNGDAGCFGDNRDYSAHLFASSASAAIKTALATEPNKPMFLYLPMQSVHAPLEAPQAYVDSFKHTVSHSKRRIFAGMVRALDEAVGNVTATLQDAGILKNTLIIFSTDNGGPADGFNGNMACNWPLRGTKRTLFEGGVRGVGIIAGPGLEGRHPGQILDGLIHVSDWVPTLIGGALSAPDVLSVATANGKDPFVSGSDGVDVWDYLTGKASQSPRTEVLLEAHEEGSTDGNGNALRVGDLKVVLRSGSLWAHGTAIGTPDGWYGGPGSSDPDTNGAYSLPTGSTSQPWTVRCPPPPKSITEGFACESPGSHKAQTKKHACLFNVTSDPCEHKDLSSDPAYKADLDRLWDRLASFRAVAVPASATASPDPKSCPESAPCPKGTACHGMTTFTMPCGTQ